MGPLLLALSPLCLGMALLLWRLGLYKRGTDFQLPGYMVQGTQDLVTTPEVSQRYFNAIQAPVKKFVLVPRAGHDPNEPLVEAEAKLLREEIRPRCI